MAVTATRFGNAPLTADWSHLLFNEDHSATSPLTSQWKTVWESLNARFETEIGFYRAPIDSALSQMESCQTYAERFQKRGFKDCLFLGIGGSSLGPSSLLQALQEKVTQAIKFHFVENPDPVDWKAVISCLQPETTLVCVVTKSGVTFETIAQATLALEWLGRSRWKSHAIFITDPKRGDLRALAEREGISCLDIPPSVGGRFSIFTPVGLFPAALSGLSISTFLQGGRQVKEYCEKIPPEKNPIFILSQAFLAHYPKRPIHVFMPYSTRLKGLSQWFVQLWGESLGKKGRGFTPVAALGATDQHSLLQLLRDGADDKVTLFVTVDQVNDPVFIPSFSGPRLQAFRLLENHSLQELLQIEYRATSQVLSRRSRPHLSLGIDRLDEASLGALYYMLCLSVSFLGSLWELDPFDQPGVEEAKGYIREALEAKSS